MALPLATCKAVNVTAVTVVPSASARRRVSPARMPSGKLTDSRSTEERVTLSLSLRPESSDEIKLGVPGVAGRFRF